MAKAYDFALDRVGLDMQSYSLFAEYVSFLKTVPAVGQYAENQKISAVRKVYQRGIVTPMLNIEQLWAEYCSFEKSINATLAEKLIAERTRDYQAAKRVSRQLETATRGLNRQAVSVPTRGSAAELKQIDLWKKYIVWEKTNPCQADDHAQFAKRVIYAYEQALLCLGFHPDLWYESALFQQEAAKVLAEKGDVKTSSAIYEEISALYERAIGTMLKDCQLLFFAYADFEEERMKYEKVRSIYNRLIAIQTVDPTLAFIQLMKFVRRTEGVQAARAVFKLAREDERTKFHVFVAAALMEYYCSKNAQVAMRVFDMGLKKFGDEPDYALAYVDFLSHLNEDNNTRVVFERILTSGTMPAEKSLEIWERYLEFESQVGDLPSILKVDKRRREALHSEFGEMQTLLLIDRYKFLNLVPCSPEQLKLLGYTEKQYKNGGLLASSHFATTDRGGSQINGQLLAPRSSAPGQTGGGGLDLTGYPRPDTNQMIPFKPKIVTTSSYHPVPGGVFPPPPAIAALMQLLPPPWTFSGPFVSVDLLMDEFRRYQLPDGPPKVDMNEKIESGHVSFGAHRVEDIKKEFYQLLATTPDPTQVMASADYTGGAQGGRKRKGGGNDSDDEDFGGNQSSSKDVYRMRMHKRVG
uniref:Suppressor of forked domain-containing protein n=1 Tax=Plectus sambesii TaxID=2011161 RepID=A0A914X8Q0_9BILA